jgi:predicted molibdopterin-dependent oxidoreductase YjgC
MFNNSPRINQKQKPDDTNNNDRSFIIIVNGRPIGVNQGMRLIDILWNAGIRKLRSTVSSSHPRGMYCGMGVCYDCLVTVNGQKMVRACMTIVEPEMHVETTI